MTQKQIEALEALLKSKSEVEKCTDFAMSKEATLALTDSFIELFKNNCALQDELDRICGRNNNE